MNAMIKPATLLVVLGILAGNARAQENKDKDNKQNKEKTIVIRPNAESKEKYTIVVDGDKVTINGKPVDEFKSKDVDITRRNDRSMNDAFAESGMPHMFKGGWNMMPENPMAVFNKALLGVKTKNADSGAMIEEVSEGSAAEKAGLKKGDIITGMNDTKIEGAESLSKAVNKYNPDDKVTISYTRDGKTFKTTATLEKNTLMFTNPQSGDKTFDFKMFRDGSPELKKFYFNNERKPKLGLQIQDIEEGKGVKILNVTDGTPAGKAGLLKDDIITSVNGKSVGNTEELKEAIADAGKDNTIKITYQRKNKTQETEIKFPKKLNTSDL